MNHNLLKRLCCPLCKNELAARCFTPESGVETVMDDSTRTKQSIEDGVLLCENCRLLFPVRNHVPVMLLFNTPFHDSFMSRYREQLGKFGDYSMPAMSPKPGELWVQETFTDEWDVVDIEGSEFNFIYTLDDLISLNKRVWLKWLDASNEVLTSVLEVGCGLGAESVALSKVVGNAEIFAIDLNLSLLKSGKVLAQNPRIHLVISSLFDIPFRESSFDLVYSQGVLHHTFSTHEAFKAISNYVKENGYMFIWVYGRDDHLMFRGMKGWLRRGIYLVENVFRPVVSRSPALLRNTFFAIMTPIAHLLIKRRVRNRGTWTMRNTEHSLRDAFSPRYAYTHTYNEVIAWYEATGFAITDVQSSFAYAGLFDKQLWGVGMTGQKRALVSSNLSNI